jgi:hypothetical protein
LGLSQFSQFPEFESPQIIPLGQTENADDEEFPASSFPASFVALLDAAQSAGEEDAAVRNDDDEDDDEPECEDVPIGIALDDVNKFEVDDDRAAYDSDDAGSTFGGDEDVHDVLEGDNEPIDDLMGDEVDSGFLSSLGGSVRLENGQVDANTLRNMCWDPVSSNFFTNGERYPRLSTVQGGPTQGLIDVYDNPAALFFLFFPRSHWVRIARESNRYERQTRGQRAADIQSRQRRRQGVEDDVVVESIDDIKARMRKTPKIEAWEIIRAIGLLIANVLCTQTMGIYLHWSMTPNGALSTGSFGRFLSRTRFKHVLAMLHFTDNENRDHVQHGKFARLLTCLRERSKSCGC